MSSQQNRSPETKPCQLAQSNADSDIELTSSSSENLTKPLGTRNDIAGNVKIMNKLIPNIQFCIDSFGLNVSVSGDISKEKTIELIDYINQYYDQVFVYGNNWHIITRTLLIDPNCLIGLILTADYYVANEELEKAINLIQKAKNRLKWLKSFSTENKYKLYTTRDELYIRGFEQWLSGKFRAINTFIKLLTSHPADLFVLKKTQLLLFLSGRFSRMLEISTMHSVYSMNKQKKYYHAMVSFAQEENHLLNEAILSAEIALKIEPSDVWALHSLAHVYLIQGRYDLGIQLINQRLLPLIETCLSFFYTHTFFHLMLFHLDKNEIEKCLYIFDKYIWPEEEELVLGAAPSCANPTADLFYKNDKTKTEDRNGAMLSLFKIEIRMTGAGAENKWKSKDESFGKLDLIDESLTSRYCDIANHVTLPSKHCLGLYGLVLLHCFLRAKRYSDAESILNQMHIACDSAHGLRTRAKYKHVFMPIALAIWSVFYRSEKQTRPDWKTAYQLLNPILDETQHEQIGGVAHNESFSSRKKHQTSDDFDHDAHDLDHVFINGVKYEKPKLISRYSLVHVVGGSGEQRSIIHDFWCEIQFAAQKYKQTYNWLKNELKARNCVKYQQRMLERCKLKLNSSNSTTNLQLSNVRFSIESRVKLPTPT